MDEVFGEENYVSLITFKKTTGAGSPSGGTEVLASISDYLLWFCRNKQCVKYRQMYREKELGGPGATQYRWIESCDGYRRQLATNESPDKTSVAKIFSHDQLTSQSSGGPQFFPVELEGRTIPSGKSGWKTTAIGMKRLNEARRLMLVGNTLRYIRYLDDFPVLAKKRIVG